MKIVTVFRQALLVVVSLGVLVVVLVWMSGGFHEKTEPGKVEASERRVTPDMTTDTVHAIVEVETTDVVGTLKAERRTEVSAKIMATIAEITVSAGDKVKRGQVVVRLDDRDLKAKLQQAKQAALATSATVVQAKADADRLEDLFKEKVVSRQEYEQQLSRYRVAQAQYERALEAVREAEVALSYAVIEAPTGGVVVDKKADEGDTARPGEPLLAIYDPQALRLEAPVREALATQLRVGDSLQVRIDALNLELEGRIDEIVPAAETASRSVLVKVAVPKKPQMVEGMFGRLVIPTRERRRHCLPESAVLEVGQLRFVDMVTSGGIVKRRAVKLGEHSEFGRVEALSGVEAGDTVVLHGPRPEPFPEDHRMIREVKQP